MEFGERGEHSAIDFANGRDVIGGDPSAEFEKFGIESRNDVERFLNFTKLGAGGRLVDEFSDDTDGGLLAERDKNAAADLNFAGETGGDFVGERVAERDCHTHVAEFVGHARE
jgi:hypothetical protein